VRSEENVGRFDIPVHYAALVHIAERDGDLGAEFSDFGRIKRSVRDPMGECRPVDELHDQVRNRSRRVRRVNSGIEDGNEVNVL
jgi:hypothetical protein